MIFTYLLANKVMWFVVLVFSLSACISMGNNVELTNKYGEDLKSVYYKYKVAVRDACSTGNMEDLRQIVTPRALDPLMKAIEDDCRGVAAHVLADLKYFEVVEYRDETAKVIFGELLLEDMPSSSKRAGVTVPWRATFIMVGREWKVDAFYPETFRD